MPERPPDLGPILRWARRTGTLIVSRAYGEWRDATERLAIYNAGVDAVYAPVLPLGGSLAARSGAGGAKSLADTAMAVDVAEFLTLVPSVQTLILATSDKDLIPVIRFAQKRGVYSGVVGSDRTAAALRELADEFVTYRQLLEDEAPQPVAVSRPVTVPPLRIARPLRRFGDPVAEPLTPLLREPRPSVSAPSFARREPVIAQVIEQAGDDAAPDPDGDNARRRRRGGRRRRGAETLNLGDDTGAVEEKVIVEVPEPSPRPAAAAQPPAVASAAAAPRPAIVPPMIAPRAPRPSAERFASPVTPAPDAAPARVVQVEEPATPTSPQNPPPTLPPVSTRGAMPIDEPAAAAELAQSSAGQPGEGAPARRPRVQLPGERLRRLVPGTDAPAGATTLQPFTEPPPTPVATGEGQGVGVHPSSDVAAPEIQTEGTDGASAVAIPDTNAEPVPTGPSLPAPASVDDTPPPGPVSAEPSGEEAARARRRRGGRTPRSSAEGSGGTEAPPVIIDGPTASPNDPDAAGAPETPADGPVRGRRRGGRARATA